MPVELIKKPVKVCRIIGEEISANVVEEDINVPDVSPDIHKILYPSARVFVKNSETTTDKVIIDGQVLIDVLYTADMEGRPLGSLNISADFNHTINMTGVKPRMKELIDVIVQHVECHIMNSRKINIKVIMDIICLVEDIYEMEIPMDVRGSDYIQVLKEPVGIKGIAGMGKEKYGFKEIVQLESNKPPIKEVLKTDFQTYIKDSQSMEGKMQIYGDLAYSILYNTDDGEIESLRGEIPYSHFLEIPEADSDMESLAYAKVRESYIDVYEDADGEKRNININVFLDLAGDTFKHVRHETLEDMYSPKWNMIIDKEGYDIDEFLCKGKDTVTIKESVKIKPGTPDILKVIYVDAKPIINEIKVMEEKAGIEGSVEVCVLYKSSFSGEPMNCINEQFPFKMVINMPKVKTTMFPKANCWIESVNYSESGDSEIVTGIVIGAAINVYNKTSKKIITNVEIKEEIKTDYDKLPAVTVYVVSKGDTLWKVAKKYNTTVDAIAELNKIENPDMINVGDKLLILKNMRQ
jgi:LysM repeat protein